ncbi:MAG: hypothetical protein KAI66_06065 [Lentisphaeria bacterium]|nr:hypothetical protein [Lentisphaeria bacterium]
MHEEQTSALSTKELLIRGAIMAAITTMVAMSANAAGFNRDQIVSSSVFAMIISATLLFWQFRLAIAFIGISALLGFKVMTLESFVQKCELDIILFLVGMMVTVGVLKELGLFTWIIQTILGMERMNGTLFVVILCLVSALMACTVDEVTSIIFTCTLIFQVCDTLKICPKPFVLISIMATNIGSCGTMLGNPVGLLIGKNGRFTFMEFLHWSFPIMMVSLIVTTILLVFWYRKEIHELTEKLQARRSMGLTLGPLVAVPYKRALFILLGSGALIASHHFLEQLLGVDDNTFLIVAPLFIAGILMIWRNQRARHYIEVEVEWWTLLFFMMLFAVAGTLEHTQVTSRIAGSFGRQFGASPGLLTPVVLFGSAIGSAFVDNVVFVAAAIPVVKELNQFNLWWALLIGGCFGGNITLIGSTANIVALGMLEKQYRMRISFLEWLKIGLVAGVVSGLTAWGGLTVLRGFMPDEWNRGGESIHHSEAARGRQDGITMPISK